MFSLERSLFTVVKNIVYRESAYLDRQSRSKQNRIVSKYYIYLLKHRHLMEPSELCSPRYSPLKKEEVMLEFQKHLDFVAKYV